MHPVALRAVIILPICIILFSILFFPLYFAGYVGIAIWNHYAEPTICTVISQDIQPDTCSYICGSYQTCYGSGNDRRCTSQNRYCYKPCYNGYYTVSWLETHTQQFLAVTYDLSSQVQNYLNTYHPIGQQFTCYYNTRDPSDMRFNLEDPTAYFIAAIFFAALFLLIIVVWLITELVLVIKSHWKTITEYPKKLCCNV